MVQGWLGTATCAGAGGVTTLDEEGLDDAVEDGAVVVALDAELDEVADGLGGFLGPELDVEWPHRRLHHHLPLRWRLQHVHRRHPCRASPSCCCRRFSSKGFDDKTLGLLVFVFRLTIFTAEVPGQFLRIIYLFSPELPKNIIGRFFEFRLFFNCN